MGQTVTLVPAAATTSCLGQGLSFRLGGQTPSDRGPVWTGKALLKLCCKTETKMTGLYLGALWATKMRPVSGDGLPTQSLLPDLKHPGKQQLLLSSLSAHEWQVDFRLTGARADHFALVL